MCSKLSSNYGSSEEQLRAPMRQYFKELVTAFKNSTILYHKSSTGDQCGWSDTGIAPNSEQKYAEHYGYTENELSVVTKCTNLGLGCGNPTLYANLMPGEVVLDLGSGAGIDALIAARAVAPTGHVFGVDLSPDLLAEAQQNALKNGFQNVEFLLGEIENLPFADSTFDVIISNCVINLVPNKLQVYREAFRVLRSGGRLAIFDLVTSTGIPESWGGLEGDLSIYPNSCAGAALIKDIEMYLKDSGFVDIKITPKDDSKKFINSWAPNMELEKVIVSALIEAKKP